MSHIYKCSVSMHATDRMLTLLSKCTTILQATLGWHFSLTTTTSASIYVCRQTWVGFDATVVARATHVCDWKLVSFDHFALFIMYNMTQVIVWLSLSSFACHFRNVL